MIRLLLVVAALIALYMTLRWFSRAKLENAKRAITTLVITIGVVLLIILAATGRLHWLFAVVGAAVPIAMRLWRAYSAYRWLRGQQKKPADAPAKVNETAVTQAYQTLGLKMGASKQEIIQAHRRLIRDAHPDRGGSDEIAQQLNAAKELLLKQLEEQ